MATVQTVDSKIDFYVCDIISTATKAIVQIALRQR